MYKSALSHLEASSIHLTIPFHVEKRTLSLYRSQSDLKLWLLYPYFFDHVRENPLSDTFEGVNHSKLFCLVRSAQLSLYLLRQLWRSGWLNCCSIGFNPNVRWRVLQTQKLSLTRRRQFKLLRPSDRLRFSTHLRLINIVSSGVYLSVYVPLNA